MGKESRFSLVTQKYLHPVREALRQTQLEGDEDCRAKPRKKGHEFAFRLCCFYREGVGVEVGGSLWGR